MYSVCFMKHLLERGVLVIHILEEPLLGELWVGQGLCEGLDISLLEVVGLGLITCEEVGVVKGVHLLSGDVRSVSTALKLVEEVQEEVQEVEDEWGDEEDEENGGLKVEEKHTSCMGTSDAHKMNLSHLMWCAIKCDEDKTRLENCALTCQCLCALCGRCSGSRWSRCHWCCTVSPRRRNTKCRVLSFWMLQFML